jgi:hypothetical protein
MTSAVPAFLEKVSRYRPRIVCFIGLGISQVVRKELLKQTPRLRDDTATPTKSPKRKSIRSKSTTMIGLHSYKLTHPKDENLGLCCPDPDSFLRFDFHFIS